MYHHDNTDRNPVTAAILQNFGTHPDVMAIAMGGSRSCGLTDEFSDTDIYVFVNRSIPVNVRRKFLYTVRTSRVEAGLTFWDDGDAFVDAMSGSEVDVMYWNTIWIEDQMKRVLEENQVSLGYSTCHWYTLLNTNVLFERDHWLTRLKQRFSVPYPESLRRAIVSKNHPVLKEILSSYYNQIRKALRRGDMVSVNHRVAALLASYFDILFALNRSPHPGEKHIVKHTLTRCPNRPAEIEVLISNIIQSIASDGGQLLAGLDVLLDDLDQRLSTDGLKPVSFT